MVPKGCPNYRQGPLWKQFLLALTGGFRITWASDVPTGTVVFGQSAPITSNSLDNWLFVSNHGKDHAQYDAPNNVVKWVAKFVSMTRS